MRKPLDTTTLDNAVMLSEKGLQLEQISKILGVGVTTLGRILQADRAAKGKDIKTLAAIRKASQSVAEWACVRAGIDPSALNAKPEEKPEPKNDNTAIAFANLLDAIKGLTAAVDAIDKRLSAMQLTQQGFRGDMSQKIKEVIEAVHVEGDIITKDMQRQTEFLASIKSNTKR